MITIRFGFACNDSLVYELNIYEIKEFSNFSAFDSLSDKAVVITNIPSYVDEESLKLLFHAFGAVESVNFYSKCNFDKYNDQVPFGCKVACLSFVDINGKIMLFKQKNCSLMWKNQCIIGFKKWKRDYASSFLTKDDYCSAVDLLEKYQERVVNEKKKKKSDLENDEDGWVTVSRGYKNCIKDSKVKQKKKKSCGDLVPFYRFEIRESKRKMIEDLQRKFEEDKKRIAHMQAVRKFKPY